MGAGPVLPADTPTFQPATPAVGTQAQALQVPAAERRPPSQGQGAAAPGPLLLTGAGTVLGLPSPHHRSIEGRLSPAGSEKALSSPRLAQSLPPEPLT